MYMHVNDSKPQTAGIVYKMRAVYSNNILIAVQ